MVLLVREQVEESVHVCANTECTQNGSADSVKRVLNISKTEGRETEEAGPFHMLTSEQTQQALLLTHMASVQGRPGAERL